MQLLLIRHGATTFSESSRYTGQQDCPLSTRGQRQISALAQRLSAVPLAAIITSDLQRALLTAQAIAEPHDLDIQIDRDLREMAMGAWEGRTYAEIQAQAPAQLAEWMRDPAAHAPPGGETMLQVRERVLRALQRWYGVYPHQRILWVTHGGVIQTLLCDILGLAWQCYWQIRCDPATITEIEWGSWFDEEPAQTSAYSIILRLNDGAHLEVDGLSQPEHAGEID